MPFLQWIPGGGRRPQLVQPTLFQGHVDLDFRSVLRPLKWLLVTVKLFSGITQFLEKSVNMDFVCFCVSGSF